MWTREQRTEYIAALRSKKYIQEFDHYRSANHTRFCALGVLAELHGLFGPKISTTVELINMLGLGQFSLLKTLNDQDKRPFSQIATVVEGSFITDEDIKK